MKSKLVLLTVVLSFVIFSTAVSAQEKSRIYEVSYSPDEPVVFEDMIISVGVENTENEARNYFMSLQITKEGKLVHEQEFIFDLDALKKIIFTPQYTPQDIGKYQVVIKLYDKFKIDLLETKLVEFNVVSHLGPFDIIINPLTTRLRPGMSLPATVLLENMGTKGVDTEVRIVVSCPTKDLAQSLTVFVPAHNRTEKSVDLQTCEEDGQYELLASIVLFNKTWVSSYNQFFVNSSYAQLHFDNPEKIKLKPGISYAFPIQVTNLGNQKISDLQFIIQKIPLDWQKTTPSSVAEVSPNETITFIVNITAPRDAELRSYEITMAAVARETLERKISTLEIVPSTIPPVMSVGRVMTIAYILIFLSLLTVLVIGGVMLRRYVREKPRTLMQRDRMLILRKIREKIKSS